MESSERAEITQKTKRFFQVIRERGLIEAINQTRRYLNGELLKWRYGPGIDVMNNDWDNLILLDAYRYDYFEKYSRFDGDLSQVFSRGNNSPQFIKQNFSGRELHDTVYVTSNPHAKDISTDVFYKIEYLLDEWDSEVGTILPEDVTKSAIEASNKYPEKRLIIHYMQPHDPHLGKTADKYRKRVETATELDGSTNNTVRWPKTRFPELYKNGQISKEELEQSYIETIHEVEKSVEGLLPELTGKTVISSDHGEKLGENKSGVTTIEHSNNTKECLFVPWLELPYNERKNIVKEEPVYFESPEQDKVEKQLTYLGYR